MTNNVVLLLGAPYQKMFISVTLKWDDLFCRVIWKTFVVFLVPSNFVLAMLTCSQISAISLDSQNSGQNYKMKTEIVIKLNYPVPHTH